MWPNNIFKYGFLPFRLCRLLSLPSITVGSGLIALRKGFSGEKTYSLKVFLLLVPKT